MWELVLGIFLGAVIGGLIVTMFIDGEELPPDDLFKR